MEPLVQVVQTLNLSPAEEAQVRSLITEANRLAQETGFSLDADAVLGLGSHMGSLLRRLPKGDLIPTVGEEVLREIQPEMLDLAQRFLAPLWPGGAEAVAVGEAALVAVHFAVARERYRSKEDKKE